MSKADTTLIHVFAIWPEEDEEVSCSGTDREERRHKDNTMYNGVLAAVMTGGGGGL